MSKLSCEELEKKYRKRRVVNGISIKVSSGEIVGLLGPNGAGKTTTIRLLLGLLAPTEGEAMVLGYKVCQQPDEIRQRTGALLEHSGLYERLSAEENLDFWRKASSEGKTDKDKTDETRTRGNKYHSEVESVLGGQQD